MQQIIERILNKDKTAEEELYKKFATKMFCLCLRYSGNEFDAEEIMHNGFCKVFDNLKTFNFINNAAFEGWVKRIMVNESLMFIRQNKKLKLISSLHDDYQNDRIHTDYHFSTDDYLSILNALPVGYKTVFNLYAIEGFSHQEIGKMLNITESTSRSQLNRARESLKQLIKKEL
jgi:RNA polymerase sigma factor (sigma-70 family)